MIRHSFLLEALDEAYSRAAWYGPTLRGSLRGVDGVQASWRPGPGRHNIWEEAVHCAYWKYVARRRLLGEKRGSFPLKGRNWFTRPPLAGEGNEAAWKADLRLLAEQHRLLYDAVEAMTRRADALSAPKVRLIRGVAFHDVYHAGQIQLTKRLWEPRRIVEQ